MSGANSISRSSSMFLSARRPLTAFLVVAVLIFGLAAFLVTNSSQGPQGQPVPDAGRITESGWDVKYEVTLLDGIRIYDAFYQKAPVLAEARLPYVLVQYDREDYPPGSLYDQLGRENGTYREDLKMNRLDDGVELEASFEFYQFPRRGSYLYIQRYKFRPDGRIDLRLEIFGPGYGDSAHYDSIWMLRPAHTPGAPSSLEELRGEWTAVEREGRLTQSDQEGAQANEEPQWRHVQAKRQLAIVPGEGDRAELFVGIWDQQRTISQDSTTPPPELIGDENLQNQPLVLWYRSHTYAARDGCGPDNPCNVGPTVVFEQGAVLVTEGGLS